MDFKTLKSDLSARNIALVAVSKTKPVEQIKAIYDQGQRIFGENRAQEMADKHPQLPDDVEWHMIGHLQSNKIKYIASFVSLIHSIDSLRLLRKVNNEAIKIDRVLDVLLQFKIAEEDSKYGLDPATFDEDWEKANLGELNGVRIRGVMAMASFVSSERQIRNEFQLLRKTFERLKESHFSSSEFDILSMGMSGDYEIAIEEGSNMVRIGSLIFGPRD